MDTDGRGLKTKYLSVYICVHPWLISLVFSNLLGSTTATRRHSGRNDALQDHSVYALLAIHKLGDMEIRGDARQHVRVVFAEPGRFHQKVDHFTDCNFSRDHKLFVHPHDYVVSRRLAARPSQVQVLSHYKFK